MASARCCNVFLQLTNKIRGATRSRLIKNYFPVSSHRNVSTTTGTKKDDIEDLWNWMPPREEDDIASVSKYSYTIPTIEGKLLTLEEVEKVLVSQGGENVRIVDMQGESLGNISNFVIASGRSARHLNKMSTTIVQALKNRKLFKEKGGAAEGDKDDDWQLVDCQKFLVHLMLPETRAHVDLESHWSQKHRPYVTYNEDPVAYEQEFSKLLVMHPCPEGYIKTDEDDEEKQDSWNVVKRL